MPPVDAWRSPMDSAAPGLSGNSEPVGGTASPRREPNERAAAVAPAPLGPGSRQHPALEQRLPPQGAPLPVGVQHGTVGGAAQQAVVAAVLQAALDGSGDLAALLQPHAVFAWPLQAGRGDILRAEAFPRRSMSIGSCGGDVSRDGGAAATTEVTASRPPPRRRTPGMSVGRARSAGRRPGVRSAPSMLHGARGNAPAGDRSPPPRRARRRSTQP